MGDIGQIVRQTIFEISESLAPTVSADYVATVQQALSVLVPANLVGWVSVELPGGRVQSMGLPDAERSTRRLRAVLDDHPMVSSYMRSEGGLAPRRISDLVGLTDFRNSRTYSELFVPLQARYQATVITSGRPPAMACWTLNRWDNDFTDKEMALLSALQGPLSVLESASGMAMTGIARPDPADRLRAMKLTPREVEVLELIAAGRTALAVGHQLRISIRTVHKHLEHIYEKLDCRDRLVAVQRSMQLGLIAPDAAIHHTRS
jgi:DNA-binding CsgD family transcriptional regulator